MTPKTGFESFLHHLPVCDVVHGHHLLPSVNARKKAAVCTVARLWYLYYPLRAAWRYQDSLLAFFEGKLLWILRRPL